MSEITPFRLNVQASEIDILRYRLKNVRWPESETVDDWSQGLPISYYREFCEYWAQDYDWGSTQARINSLENYSIKLDGLNFHFIHVRSSCSKAKPLLITHGWPGSIIEFLKIMEPLAEPQKHGGIVEDACDLIFPTLPGFGFSDKPKTSGWGVDRIARAWDALMSELGYHEYFAQGGDWGAGVTTALGSLEGGRCKSIHVNMPTSGPTQKALRDPTEADKTALEKGKNFSAEGLGYHKVQSTRPQTVGYLLADSPAGQAAWILEKFREWTDCDGHPENVLTRDELIDNIMFYWLTNSGASSARIYWETFNPNQKIKPQPVLIPSAISLFPKENMVGPRSWAEQRYKKIIYWNELDKGGHFAAFEQPELFVEEIRKWLRLFN